MTKSSILSLVLSTTLFAAAPPELSSITPESLSGHVSFLASDLLEGRATRSKGLDIAAEYVASRFRAAGLEPVGDDGYFQTAPFLTIQQSTDGFDLQLHSATSKHFTADALFTLRTRQALKLENIPVMIVDAKAADKLKPSDVHGKALVVDAGSASLEDLRNILNAKNPAAIIITGGPHFGAVGRSRLVPDDEKEVPYLRLNAAIEDFKAAHTITLKAAAPKITPLKLKNIVGLLRGSDPELSKTCVILSAHYDHVGIARRAKDGDSIMNGANDNASGTASVIEIATAFAKLPVKPRRSILFAAWVAEEEGLYGSSYYTRHPIMPLKETVAVLNLEHMGRSDAISGVEKHKLAVTGYEYTTVGDLLHASALPQGVDVYGTAKDTAMFFDRSDNLPFAQHGIPAHTIVAVFIFSDYHDVGDHWNKLDYPNMADVTRALATGLIDLANSPQAPTWKTEDPVAKQYSEGAAKDPEHTGN